MGRMAWPRIAFFPDSFHEVNGVAHTARQFEKWARLHGVPFLCIRAALPGGSRRPELRREGDLWTLDLPRSRMSVRLEQDLWFDPLFFRHRRAIRDALRAFQPQIIHITGPSELGIAGALEARRLRVPLAASWHTNVHEYAARRSAWLTRRLGGAAARVSSAIESGALALTARFYRLAKVLYAPNPGLCTLLEQKTGRPCHLMTRGVDTDLFSPARRPADTAPPGPPLLGYVGRLSVEKNVALLPLIQAELVRLGVAARWLIVGHGAEQERLQAALGSAATFPGVLRGDALARAYAAMDLFVFPSHTDTFGNVVLEALASGVPAMVTPDGGPAHIVQDGFTGRVLPDSAFAGVIAQTLADPAVLQRMRVAAREYALGCSWDAVFASVVASTLR